MHITKQPSWEQFKSCYSDYPTLGLALDLSRINFAEGFFETMAPRITTAFAEMAELESGGIANPDERRMVGHYWLRNPQLSPTAEIRLQIENMIADVKDFAAKVHSGEISGERCVFENLLVIGIGGSVLGPQFISHALGDIRRNKIRPFFFDNTDPEGMKQTLDAIGADLDKTLCIVTSKSGGTSETRNGMIVAKNAYESAGLTFERHAVAITQTGSKLCELAVDDGWIRTFPMWDWVGGRTSSMSAVGLLPAAVIGVQIDEFLAGARACDKVTRVADVRTNPACLLALTWYCAGSGLGQKNMVIIPYNDRLELFSRYLQQLVMESLGKRLDKAGKVVNQGISVFGNKGSTDQHSYIQQLIEGQNDFFLTVINARCMRSAQSVLVEPGFSSGDFLNAFMTGTREALSENGRDVVTITVNDISAFSVGILISLYERAVGLYASIVGVNAYHQPGVESGKKAASKVLNLQKSITTLLGNHSGKSFTIESISLALGAEVTCEEVFGICEFLAANPALPIFAEREPCVFATKYCFRN